MLHTKETRATKYLLRVSPAFSGQSAHLLLLKRQYLTFKLCFVTSRWLIRGHTRHLLLFCKYNSKGITCYLQIQKYKSCPRSGLKYEEGEMNYLTSQKKVGTLQLLATVTHTAYQHHENVLLRHTSGLLYNMIKITDHLNTDELAHSCL